ncbi:hypothetical protein [Nannocystis sp.]|uniref:hypothetical protein n=1 Tax=Nannocystis sp. TaxID=1962667 RepID=UPI0025CC4099|nr:hypothetical protein [Nannocystis sp.]MBK7828264.1 hypothetical protein [Nannocystis sp.]
MLLAAQLRPSPARQRLCRLVAVLVAMSLGTPAVAAPAGSEADDPAIAAATRTYEEGITYRDAGNFIAAAESFTTAYRDLPMKERETRAIVLFDLIDARRNAFAEGEGPGQLCECERLLVAYLEEIKQSFGSKGDKFPDTRKAKKLLAELRKQIDAARGETPGLDCATTPLEKPAAPEPAPDPAPDVSDRPAMPDDRGAATPDPDPAQARRARTFMIAGAVSTGVGGLFLGMMTAGLVVGRNAERDGDARTQAAIASGSPLSQYDPDLQALIDRGNLGNRLAIAGGVLATAAIAAGVTLLVLGLRARPRPRAGAASMAPRLAPAVAPALGPNFTGATLVLRF